MARPRRPDRRSRSRDLTIEHLVSAPAGPNIQCASVEDVMDAVTRAPKPHDWPRLAPMVVPIFQRLRPYGGAVPPAIRVVVPPGVSVSIAVDIGPALLHVTPEIAASWNVGLEEITARALANVAGRANATPKQAVFRQPIDGVMTAGLQSGTGSASTFVLQPAVLPRLFGPGPHLFIAPMRDLLIALPADVDRGLALWIHQEIAFEDPNCLAPIGFLVRDGSVSLEPLEPEFAVA